MEVAEVTDEVEVEVEDAVMVVVAVVVGTEKNRFRRSVVMRNGVCECCWGGVSGNDET